MAKVIFLNGMSSSGKTSIVKAIQHISPIPFLHFGVDTIIDMMPSRWLSYNENAKDGCYFQSYKNEYGKAISCHSGAYGEKVFSMGMKIIKTILDCNIHLIIDEVIWKQDTMNEYFTILNEYQTVYVRIKCSRQSAQEREILRRNRAIGLANDQFDKVESLIIKYHLEVNTDTISSFQAADKILKLVL